MDVIVLASSLRTAGNFLPVLEHMQARGDTVSLVWIPLGASIGEDPAALGLARVHAPAVRARAQAAQHLGSLVRHLVDADIVLMDDMIHWPAQEMTRLLRRHAPQVPIAAFQHGLYQAWNRMNQDFLADYFLCFGRRHVMNFDARFWARVLPVGLPKLDRLSFRTGDVGEYILYVAQSAPRPGIVAPILSALEDATGKAVRIRPHPGHMDLYAGLRGQFQFLPSNEAIEIQISASAWVLTTHSTAVLEAMRMGVTAVLLPSFGLTDFTFFPGIAVDFSADKVLLALDVHRSDEPARNRFMEEHCRGFRTDSTRRALAAIDMIVGVRTGTMTPEALLGSMGAEHPLNSVFPVRTAQ